MEACTDRGVVSVAHRSDMLLLSRLSPTIHCILSAYLPHSKAKPNKDLELEPMINLSNEEHTKEAD